MKSRSGLRIHVGDLRVRNVGGGLVLAPLGLGTRIFGSVKEALRFRLHLSTVLSWSLLATSSETAVQAHKHGMVLGWLWKWWS